MLEYMQANQLAANPDKTKLIMFGNKKDRFVRVGASLISESDSETLLGVEISRKMTWGCHFEKLEKALHKRIGIIRRLSYHLPKKTMLKVIDPVFTSKLTYGLEIFTDPSTVLECLDPILRKLQNLHNKAMRAALGRYQRCRKKISSASLLLKTGQSSILELILRAVSRHAGLSMGGLAKDA